MLNIRLIFTHMFSLACALEILMYFMFDLSGFGLGENVRLSRILILASLFFGLMVYISQSEFVLRFRTSQALSILPMAAIVFVNFLFFLLVGDDSHLNSIAAMNGFEAASALFATKDVLIYLYLFLFAFVSSFVFSNIKTFEIFFRYFSFCFWLSVSIGLISLAASVFEIQIIDRQFNYSERRYIGVRFFGLFGEPRDAAVALIFGSFIYSLRQRLLNIKPNKIIFILILVLVLMTQSGSLLFSLPCFAVLYVFFLTKLGLRGMFRAGLALILIGAVTYVALVNSYRLTIYLQDILSYFHSERTLSSHVQAQFVNIWPFVYFFEQLFDYNFLFVVFGEGPAAVNFIKAPNLPYELGSPHAQIPRLLMNYGILGVLGWMIFLIAPLFAFRSKRRHQISLFEVEFFYLALFAVCLMHRSHLIVLASAFLWGLCSNLQIAKQDDKL